MLDTGYPAFSGIFASLQLALLNTEPKKGMFDIQSRTDQASRFSSYALTRHCGKANEQPGTSIQNRVSSIQNRVSSNEYPESRIQNRASSIEHPESSIEDRTSSIEYSLDFK